MMRRSLPDPHHLPTLDAAHVHHDDVRLKSVARVAANGNATT